MLAICRQSLMKYLASVSLAASCGLADPGASLAQIPARLITELTDETLKRGWLPSDRMVLLQLLTKDPRAHVRCAVAQAIPSAEEALSPDAQQLLRTLAADRAWPVREAAAQALGRCLRLAPVSARVRTMCEWALTENAAERLAVARALARTVRVPGADIALAHLAREPEPAIRQAALSAAEVQLSPDDPIFSEVAAAALVDPDRRVRRATKKMLARSTRPGPVMHLT
jgi:hypothetical protein